MPEVHSRRAALRLFALGVATACATTDSPTGPGAATALSKHAGDAQQAAVGTAVLSPPSARVTDANGRGVPGVTVSFAVTAGGGIASGTVVTSNADGVATVGSWTVGTTLGLNSITATAPGLSGSPLTFTATGVTSPIAGILDSLRTVWDLPALGAAIVTRTGERASGVVGVRRAGGTNAATLTDKFHIGSNLKAITAGLVGVLVDEGKLQWTTTLATALPALASTMRSEYQAVTIRDLLSQQSGFLRDPTIVFTDPTPREQRDSLLRWSLRQAPVSGRGAYYYSNVNYMIAAAIAERSTNIAFEQLLVDRLLGPLGITSVGFGAAGTATNEDQPWGHFINASGVRIAVAPGSAGSDNPPVYGPAGRAHLSVSDWATWIRAVLSAEAGLTSPWQTATARMLTTPAVTISGSDGYALGWGTTTRSWAGPTQRVLTHSGSNTLHYSVAWLAADAGWGIIVVTNQGGTRAASAADATAARLISYHLLGR